MQTNGIRIRTFEKVSDVFQRPVFGPFWREHTSPQKKTTMNDGEGEPGNFWNSLAKMRKKCIFKNTWTWHCFLQPPTHVGNPPLARRSLVLASNLCGRSGSPSKIEDRIFQFQKLLWLGLKMWDMPGRFISGGRNTQEDWRRRLIESHLAGEGVHGGDRLLQRTLAIRLGEDNCHTDRFLSATSDQ